jgi:probable phosphoglycerate mutase
VTTRLLLLRHGESVWNAAGRWQGWADPPLSAEGEHQAREAGRLLAGSGFTAVASSDLHRARRTAELAATGMGLDWVHVEPGLREYHVGEWSGLTRAEIEARWPGWIDDWRQGRLVATPGGEARGDFQARITRAVAAVAARLADQTVLVITHGGVIGTLERALGAPSRRLAHLGGRWIEVSGRGLSAGPARFLFEPDADAEAAAHGRPPAAAEGEGTEVAAPAAAIEKSPDCGA